MKYVVSKITLEEFAAIKTLPDRNKDFQLIYGDTDTKYGRCCAAFHNDSLCFLDFFDDVESKFGRNGINSKPIYDLRTTNRTAFQVFPNCIYSFDNEFITKKVQQMFDETSTEEVKILLKGSPFQLRVWEELLKIPRGTTCFYEDIALAIGAPKAARAVGTAIGKNPLGYIVPCHRVINKHGNIGKYCWGVQKKTQILKDENAI